MGLGAAAPRAAGWSEVVVASVIVFGSSVTS